MQGMPVGRKEEVSCGGIPMRGAAAITMGVVFFILFFEIGPGALFFLLWLPPPCFLSSPWWEGIVRHGVGGLALSCH